MRSAYIMIFGEDEYDKFSDNVTIRGRAYRLDPAIPLRRVSIGLGTEAVGYISKLIPAEARAKAKERAVLDLACKLIVSTPVSVHERMVLASEYDAREFEKAGAERRRREAWERKWGLHDTEQTDNYDE